MPTLNILTAGTRGVDMKSNPLFLGRERLHAATNMTFDEGTLKTRPGFRYLPLGIRGRFQGSSVYSPSEGISFKPFADPVSSLVTVAAGCVSVNDTTTGCLSCKPKLVCGSGGFGDAGEVHVFQAENYLIFQSPSSFTYYWDGAGCLSQSPGLTLEEECAPYEYRPLPVELPEEKLPCPQDFRIVIRDASTLKPIYNAALELVSEYGRRFLADSNTDGVVEHEIHSGDYTYTAKLTGYITKTGTLPLTVSGTYYIDLDPEANTWTVDILFRQVNTGIILPNTRVEIALSDTEKKTFEADDTGSVTVRLSLGAHQFTAREPLHEITIGTLTVLKKQTFVVLLVPLVPNPPPPPRPPFPPDDPNNPEDPEDPPVPGEVAVPVLLGTTGPAPEGEYWDDPSGENPTTIHYPLFFNCRTDETFISFAVYRSQDITAYPDYPSTVVMNGASRHDNLEEIRSDRPGWRFVVSVDTKWGPQPGTDLLGRLVSAFYITHNTTQGSARSDIAYIYYTGA